MKVPNYTVTYPFIRLSLSRLQNEGSQRANLLAPLPSKSIKATE